MHSMTYKDIIDEKTAEWRNGLKKLEDLAAKSTAETRAYLMRRSSNSIRR